jgi:hypothetical protein
MPFAILAAVAGGTGLLGSIIGAGATTSAANTQAQAAEQAAKIQQQEFNQTTTNEAPFLQAGNNSLAALMQGLGLGTNTPGSQAAGVGFGSLTAPFNPSNLAQTPGYQFDMSQGLQALLNSSSATGGVGGGNTLKAITSFGQGLASTTYQQQLADFMAQQQQQFGELQTVAGSGQNAAANLGALGNQAASTIGSDLIGAGNAQAAGTVGTANAITGGLNGVSSNFLLAQLLSGGGGGGSTAGLSGLSGLGDAIAGAGS